MTILERKLSDFNCRAENAELTEYLSQTNIFETIGKSRNEMMHSRMLLYLLSSSDFSSSSYLALKHLLDVVIIRDSQQNELLDDDFRQAVLTNSIHIDRIDECEAEMTLGNYVKFHKSNCCGFKSNIEEAQSNSDKDRLDIYLNASIKGCKRNSVELFIENKVYSKEGDRQTKRYYDVCRPQEGKGKNKSSYKLFIYLSPIPSGRLSCPKQLDKNEKPCCDKYIQINYQDILDFVITPLLLDSSLSARLRTILNEYVNCLELPALPDDSGLMLAPKGFSIMATGSREKELVSKFMKVEANRILINASAAVFKGEKLYQVGASKYLTKEDAILQALENHISSHRKWDSLNCFASVIGKQGGDYPFMVYSVSKSDTELKYLPSDYWIWDGEPFATVVDAMISLLPRYIFEGNSLDDFNDIYDSRGGGHLIDFSKKDNFEESVLSDSSKCYVNKSCGAYVTRINDVLQEHNFPEICHLSSDTYESIVSGNEWIAKYRTVPLSKYKRLGSSNFYYRRSESDITRLMQIDSLGISQVNDTKEYDLLLSFYEQHRPLIISINKILSDDFTDL